MASIVIPSSKQARPLNEEDADIFSRRHDFLATRMIWAKCLCIRTNTDDVQKGGLREANRCCSNGNQVRGTRPGLLAWG